MIDSIPRLLPRKRLEQLVHGLRERYSSSAQKIAEEVEQLSDRIVTLEEDFEDQLQLAQTRHKPPE